jgi:hypothetical protein
MHRATGRDIGYPLSVLFGKLPTQRNVSPDQIDPCVAIVLTILDITAAHTLVAAPYAHGLQRPAFPPHIQEDRHGRSGAQGGEEKLVGTRAQVVTFVGRLVRDEGVARGGEERASDQTVSTWQ